MGLDRHGVAGHAAGRGRRVPLVFLAAENLVPRWFSFIIRQVFNVLRAIPEIILVMALIPTSGSPRPPA